MVVIDGDTVKITRGDSAAITVTIYNADGSVYTPGEGDAVRFAVKKSADDPAPFLEKTVPTDTMTLTLLPEDTRFLPDGKTRGQYHYDMKLIKSGGEICTFICWKDFIGLEGT